MPFDSTTAAIAGSQPKARSPYQQAVDMQRLITQQADCPELTPAALSQLARAWCELEERKRILTQTPAPKPIDVSQSQGKRKAKAAPTFEE